jgi:hypothetical protein
MRWRRQVYRGRYGHDDHRGDTPDMILIAERVDGTLAWAHDDAKPGQRFQVVLQEPDGTTHGPLLWESALARGYWREPRPSVQRSAQPPKVQAPTPDNEEAPLP